MEKLKEPLYGTPIYCTNVEEYNMMDHLSHVDVVYAIQLLGECISEEEVDGKIVCNIAITDSPDNELVQVDKDIIIAGFFEEGPLDFPIVPFLYKSKMYYIHIEHDCFIPGGLNRYIKRHLRFSEIRKNVAEKESDPKIKLQKTIEYKKEILDVHTRYCNALKTTIEKTEKELNGYE